MLVPLASTLRRSSSRLHSKSFTFRLPGRSERGFKGCLGVLVFFGLFYLSQVTQELQPNLERLEKEVLSESPSSILKAVSLAEIHGIGNYGLVIGKKVSWMNQATLSREGDKIELNDLFSSDKAVNTANLSARLYHLGVMLWKLNNEVQQNALLVASIHPDFTNSWVEGQLLKRSLAFISRKKGLVVIVSISEDTECTNLASNLQQLVIASQLQYGPNFKIMQGVWKSPKDSSLWYTYNRKTPTSPIHPALYKSSQKTTRASPDATAYILRVLAIYPWMNIRDVELTLEYVSFGGAVILVEIDNFDQGLIIDFLEKKSKRSKELEL